VLVQVQVLVSHGVLEIAEAQPPVVARAEAPIAGVVAVGGSGGGGGGGGGAARAGGGGGGW